MPVMVSYPGTMASLNKHNLPKIGKLVSLDLEFRAQLLTIVSLTKFLVNALLSLTVLIKSNVVLFFAEKMLGVFAVQKLLTFFRKKRVVFLHSIHLKFLHLVYS